VSLLIFQITTVLLTCLVCGWIARRFGQARVVGEIAGGILIGPSVFGRLAPYASARLFPQTSLGSFDVLSTVGLILFLFLIGSELDYAHVREQKRTATLASLTSMIVPFGLAVAIAPMLRQRFAPDDVGRLPFMLFLGISMSITAFPVLARILEERGMHSTPLGATAILCAAVDDVCAWSLLAVAMTLLPSGNHSVPVSHRFLWLGAYLGVMILVIRPLGGWLARRRAKSALSYELMGILLVFVFASAAVTDAIGVHPLFGAFLAGLCFPRVKQWQVSLRARLDVIISLVLLPLFFAITGMRTRLDLLSGTSVWMWTGLVLLLAVMGKMGGAIAAARWTGYGWRNSVALGALVNTRGLVELVVLNIAYSAHVFSPALFTMLVAMALVTTMMTVPLLNWLKIGKGAGSEQDLSRLTAA
jgi:Kef-type K+ transport system membrane component KefB